MNDMKRRGAHVLLLTFEENYRGELNNIRKRFATKFNLNHRTNVDETDADNNCLFLPCHRAEEVSNIRISK